MLTNLVTAVKIALIEEEKLISPTVFRVNRLIYKEVRYSAADWVD